MRNTICTGFNVKNAVNFRNDISSMYLYLGRTAAWDDENNPPAFLNDINDKQETRDAIEYLTMINKSDTCLAIPRIDWFTETVYEQYSSEGQTQQPYVMNNNNDVYKCMSNNNGANSIVPPVGTSVNTILLSDGYQWKFMFNLSGEMALKFLTEHYIPLPTEDVLITNESKQVMLTAQHTAGSPPGGHGSNPMVELGAKYIIISKTIEFANITADEFQHRQFGLLNEPMDTDGNLLLDGHYLIDSNSNVDLNTGQMISISNHQVIDSVNDVSETIQIVLSF